MNVWAVDSLRVASIFPAMSRITDAFPTSPDPKRLSSPCSLHVSLNLQPGHALPFSSDAA